MIDFAAAVDDDTITRHASGDVGEVTWRRAGRELTLTTAAGVRPVEHDGNEVQRMLLAFHDAALGRARPAATLAEALDVMRAARRVVDALAAAGAPFDRPNAPKHVASRALQPAR